jgi:hypothetical protein
VNGINPYFNGPISNFNNRFIFVPVSWLSLRVGSQVPMTSDGFTELNTDFNVMPTRNLSFGFGTRYIDNYNGSSNDNQYPINVFCKLNDHWSVSGQGIYNTPGANSPVQGNSLIFQRYMVHRDLSSWVMSLGIQVQSNQSAGSQGSDNLYGVLFTMTLKDLPQITLPLAFTQLSSQQQQTGASPLSTGF